MHHDRELRTRVGKRLGHVALLVALAVVPVLLLNSLATADTHPDPRAGDTLRSCTVAHGLAGAAGQDPRSTSTATRRTRRRQAGACGLDVRHAPRGTYVVTDDERRCLAEHGVTLPPRSADGSRPEVAPGERAALRQAAAACGLPAHGPHGVGVV